MTTLFLASFSFAAAVVTGILARLSAVEIPDPERRMRSGGFFIWTSVVLGAIATRLMLPSTSFLIDPGILSLVLVVMVGLADDFLNLHWSHKLVGQFVCLAPLVFSFGPVLASTSPIVAVLMGTGWVIWLLVLINGTNLMDGIDGYVGMWSFLTLIGMLYISYRTGLDFPLARVVALSIGPLALFVAYNRHPARIFLGDTGSLSFGFLTGLFGLLLLVHRPDQARLVALLVVMTLPLFEVATTVYRRLTSGADVFSRDVDHVHHRVVRLFNGRVRRAGNLLSVCQVILLLIAYLIDQYIIPYPVIVGSIVWLIVVSLIIRLRTRFADTEQEVTHFGQPTLHANDN